MKRKIPDPNKMRLVKGPKLSEKQFRSAKVKITTFLDEDVVIALKELAVESGGRYQTLLNQILRSSLFGKGQNVLDRIERLEKEVFEKKAA